MHLWGVLELLLLWCTSVVVVTCGLGEVSDPEHRANICIVPAAYTSTGFVLLRNKTRFSPVFQLVFHL